jgi:hypothetical protein
MAWLVSLLSALAFAVAVFDCFFTNIWALLNEWIGQSFCLRFKKEPSQPKPMKCIVEAHKNIQA